LRVISEFNKLEQLNLWETVSILKRGSFRVHDVVEKVILMGSRGALGGFTDTSDIDIGLVTRINPNSSDAYLHEILDVTLDHWDSAVHLDLKLMFDTNQCLMKCMDHDHMVYELCELGHKCLGAFDKTSGRKASESYSAEALYPIITIWEQDVSGPLEIPVKIGSLTLD